MHASVAARNPILQRACVITLFTFVILKTINQSNALSVNLEVEGRRLYQVSSALKDVRFCNVKREEQEFCQRVVALLNRKQQRATFSCVMENTIQDCFSAIARGSATIRNFAMGEIYDAHVQHHLKVLTVELHRDNQTTQHTVMTVRREFCEGNEVNLSKLRGKSLCSTGYQRPAGWQMPLGYLISTGVMPVVSRDSEVMDDAESVAAFFGKVCAAGAHDNGPRMTADGYGALTPQLCSACKTNCTTQDPYATYKGAFRCLLEGAGDVMFSGLEAVLRFTSDGSDAGAMSWSKEPKENFRLLCPTGGCARVDEYKTCNYGEQPGRALMVRADYPAAAELQAILVTAGNDSDFKSLVFNTTTNPEDYVLRAVSRGVVAYNNDTLTYLGSVADRLRLMDQLRGQKEALVVVSPRGHHLGSGQLAGVVVGAVLGGVVVGMLVHWALQEYWRRHRSSHPFISSGGKDLEIGKGPRGEGVQY